MKTNINQTWDDIIVGAGTAGTVLASRLSEIPDRRVLLIEAGPDFPKSDQVPAPLRDAKTPVMSGYHWEYAANLRTTGLLQNMAQSVGVLTKARASDTLAVLGAVMRSSQSFSSTLQQFPYMLGKLVGGSSAINASAALRPYKEDFDTWTQLGNDQWSWSQVLPYFLRIESDRDFSGSEHGDAGPIPITRPKMQNWHELQTAFHTACKELGIQELADFNGSSSSGVGPMPSNSLDAVRISTAVGYLEPARERSNLTIVADCTVSKLLFEGRRAVGVEILDKKGEKIEFAGKRICVCAGAINSVGVLLRSGIGSAKLCRALDVDLVADLPGVGENLADHPAVILWMTPRAGVCREGMPSHQIMARVASKAGRSPDLNLFMLSNILTDKIPMLGDLLHSPLASGVSVVMAKSSNSRGKVYLEDPAPDSKPVIDLNFGTSPEDMECLMHGVRLAWKIIRSRHIAERTQSVFMWNDATVNNDKALKSAVNRFIGAAWHAVGTAKMGPASDPMAVVDQHCRVHRVENLRVVDASVMPVIPSTSTGLCSMMLAERVADWMKNETE